MAVTVITEQYGSGNPAYSETYAEANSIRVDDGHLYVQKTAGSTSKTTLGVYAPGKWLRASKDDQAAGKKHS